MSYTVCGLAGQKKKNTTQKTPPPHTHTQRKKNPTWSGGNLTCARVAEFGSLQTFAETWLDFTGKKIRLLLKIAGFVLRNSSECQFSFSSLLGLLAGGR